jgi:hypothetical protein
MRFLVCLFLACMASQPVLAQEKTAKKAPAARQPHPSLVKVTDVPGLPRVLLIGDSISMGYTVDVRKMLDGKANVHRIPTNGGPTSRGITEIDKWLGNSKWDVIHFNWGLHDLKYITADPSKRADPKEPGAHWQVSLEDYEKNLTALVAKMKGTGAKLIWCNTTHVPSGTDGRIEGEEDKFNAVASKVMKAAGIPTNDLRAHALAKPDAQLPANVHYSPEGSRYLAEKVSAVIMDALKTSPPKT